MPVINVTPTAAEQIRKSAKEGFMVGMPLRLAAKRQADGSIHYGMGFDDQSREDDMRFTSEGIDLVVASLSLDLLDGTTVDYVEMEPGKFEFIFMNPNDPHYEPPKKKE
jgi:iron-sulfur cluster assembly protein